MRVLLLSLLAGAPAQGQALLHALASPNEKCGGVFGWAVAGVEDVDGDGRGDLLIGARDEDPGTSPIGAGRAYVFSGGRKGTAVERGAPEAFVLHAPHPNPFADTTTVSFTLAVPSAVRMSVHDVLGREVAVLAEGARAAGVYLVRLAAGGVTAVCRVVVAR